MADNSVIETQSLRDSLYRPVFLKSWPEASLYELALWTNGMAFRNIDFTSIGRPVIKIAEIKNGISGQTKFTDAEYESRYFVTAGEMLFSWSGQPETSIDVFWWRGQDGWLNQHIFKVKPAESLDPVFFFYMLRYLKPNFIRIARNKQTTGLGHVTIADLKRMTVGVPPLPEQRAIAAILGALDDKIELNCQMNQTLEAMAQALFKSWFADFEPFRDQDMQDSPLGPIPRGWRVGTVGDLADVTSGKRPLGRMTHRTEDYTVPLYGGAGPMAWVQEPLYYEPLLITGRVGTLGVVNRTTKPCWPSDNTLVVLVKFSAAYPFLCYSMKRFDFDSLNRGSTQPLVTQTDLSNVKLAVPPIEVLGDFSGVVYSIFQLQDANVEQSHTLAAIRDTLLPKLLSGEIRVKDVEKFVEVNI